MTTPASFAALGLRSTSAWAWGDLTLHVAEDPSAAGPWLVCVGDEVVFAIRPPLDSSTGVAFQADASQLIYSFVSPSPQDRWLIPDGPAVLTLAHEHFKGGTHCALMVLTPDGIIRGMVAGTLDPAQRPYVVGPDLFLPRTPDHWRKGEDDLARVRIADDPGAANPGT